METIEAVFDFLFLIWLATIVFELRAIHKTIRVLQSEE